MNNESKYTSSSNTTNTGNSKHKHHHTSKKSKKKKADGYGVQLEDIPGEINEKSLMIVLKMRSLNGLDHKITMIRW